MAVRVWEASVSARRAVTRRPTQLKGIYGAYCTARLRDRDDCGANDAEQLDLLAV